MSLYPADGVAATVLAAPNMQGAEVRIFIGAIDPATGAAIGAPKLEFLGEIDVPTLTSRQGERTVDFTMVSVFDRLFSNDEGIRATDGWLQSVWPGDLGLTYMTGTVDQLFWGGKPPAGYIAAAPGGTALARYAAGSAFDKFNIGSFF
jgi:hypothetical protein